MTAALACVSAQRLTMPPERNRPLPYGSLTAHYLMRLSWMWGGSFDMADWKDQVGYSPLYVLAVLH